MAIFARSSLKSKNMSVSQEIQDYFSKLTEPLATKVGLTELFEIMKGEIVEKFETKFEEQNNKNMELKNRIAAKENIINNLLIKCDDPIFALGLPYCEGEIDRVHRIGKEYKDKNSGKKVKSIIIKFKSWNS